MALEQDIADLVQASNNLTTVVDGKIQNIDQRVDDSQVLVQQWLDTRHVGFSLVDTLMDHSNGYITLAPRFGSIEEATSFEFNSADDYVPTGCYTDIANTVPATPNWFSEPVSTQFTGRLSVYANISIGSAPHPSPKPVTRIALLHNSIGAHHGWITTGSPTPNYRDPRLFMGKGRHENLEIKGQSYGVSNYDDLVSLAENETHNVSIGFSHVRLINLGPYPIHIKGFWMIYHGHQKES